MRIGRGFGLAFFLPYMALDIVVSGQDTWRQSPFVFVEDRRPDRVSTGLSFASFLAAARRAVLRPGPSCAMREEVRFGFGHVSLWGSERSSNQVSSEEN